MLRWGPSCSLQNAVEGYGLGPERALGTARSDTGTTCQEALNVPQAPPNLEECLVPMGKDAQRGNVDRFNRGFLYLVVGREGFRPIGAALNEVERLGGVTPEIHPVPLCSRAPSSQDHERYQYHSTTVAFPHQMHQREFSAEMGISVPYDKVQVWTTTGPLRTASDCQHSSQNRILRTTVGCSRARGSS